MSGGGWAFVGLCIILCGHWVIGLLFLMVIGLIAMVNS